MILKEEDWVFYQHQGKKSWLGPVQIFAVHENLVYVFANGSIQNIPRCTVYLLEREDIEKEQPPDRGEDLIKNIQGWADLVKNLEPNSDESCTLSGTLTRLSTPPGDKSSHSSMIRSSGDSPKQAVDLKDEDFGDNMNENEAEEIRRRKTCSMTAEERKVAQTEECTLLKTSKGGQTLLKTWGQNLTEGFMENGALGY